MNPCFVDGQLFRSESDAAKHMQVSPTTIRYHLNRGTLDTMPKGGTKFSDKPCEINGVKYKCQNAAALALGISKQAVSERLYRIRFRKTYQNTGKTPVEIDGVKYSSITAAARALNLHRTAITKRLSRSRVLKVAAE